MRILSVDQSYKTGWAFAQVTDGTLTILDFGEISVKKHKTDKNYHLYQQLHDLMEKLGDFDVILYEGQYQKNMHIITGVLLASISPGLTQVCCSPSHLRKVLFNQKMSKNEAQAAFKALYPQHQDIDNPDILDALIQVYAWFKELPE